MKKEENKKITIVLFISLLLVLSLSSVSAGWFGDFWNKITGRAVSTNGLVAYYDFEGDAQDSSGNNHGTVHGATFVQGKIGQGLSFDGVNDYVDLGDKGDFEFEANQAFSINVFIYANDNSITRKIINKRFVTSGSNSQYWILVEPGGVLNFGGYNGTILKETASLSIEAWHYITAQRLTDGTMELYVDGELKDNSASTTSALGVSDGNLIIGADSREIGKGDPFNEWMAFKGIIDEVAIYNRALSAEEIKEIYSGCTEDWSCNQWSTCTAGQQTRTCIDLNACGTKNNKPSETQSCCVESWSCGSWSACISGQQTRTCIDLNACGTKKNKPLESQTCCAPSCANKQCGDDGCGGSCGQCEVSANCINEQCINSCADKDKDNYFVRIVSGEDCGLIDCNDNNTNINPGKNEACGNNLDDNCDGSIDENCECSTGENRTCGTSDVGECKYGTQTCVDSVWGFCGGNQESIDEICDNKDNDCDGEVDENLVRVCGTTDIGECRLGIEMCSAGNWIGCNSIEPINEHCNDGRDNDCDGSVDEQDCSLDCSGCIKDNFCLNKGIRLTIDSLSQYCDYDKTIKLQKQVDDLCQNNYECLSNQCSDGVCVGLIEEIRKQTGLLWRILCAILHPISDENMQQCIDEHAQPVA